MRGFVLENKMLGFRFEVVLLRFPRLTTIRRFFSKPCTDPALRAWWMIRSCLLYSRSVCSALLALVLLVCALEVGLRVYDSCNAHRLIDNAEDDPLLARSWLTHHKLKPLRSLVGRNPDTNAAVKIATNSFGLRGREIEVPKPLGVFRIVCLGDETLFAPEIDESETLCARLQALLQPWTPLKLEVVNAGVPDYCPLLSYLQLRHSLLALQPDVIVLNFDMSDVADDYRFRRHTKMGALGEPLVCPHPQREQPTSKKQDGFYHRFLLVWWGRKQLGLLPRPRNRPEDRRSIDAPSGRFAWLTDNPPDWSMHIEQAFSPIDHLNRLADRCYARFVVATYPAPWQISKTASNGDDVRAQAGVPQDALYQSRAPFEALSEYVGRRKIPYLDTSPAFRRVETPPRLYLKNAPHFSRFGHELYARQLARFLVQHAPGIWKNENSSHQDTPPPRQTFSETR